MDHVEEVRRLCSIRSAEVDGNIQRASRAATDGCGNDGIQITVDGGVAQIEGTDCVHFDKRACGWLGKDDEGFGGSDTCSFERSCGADGVVDLVKETASSGMLFQVIFRKSPMMERT